MTATKYKIKEICGDRSGIIKNLEMFIENNKIEIVSFSHAYNGNYYRGILIYKDKL